MNEICQLQISGKSAIQQKTWLTRFVAMVNNNRLSDENPKHWPESFLISIMYHHREHFKVD